MSTWSCLSICFWVLILSLVHYTVEQNASMRAWASEGYYYSHRCQITIEVVSNYFQSSYQLFHVLARQNAYFFNTIESENIFYIKGTNSMQNMMTSNAIYCKFPMSETYYCPFISLNGYNPVGIKYLDTVNATHKKMTLRISRAICPAEGNTMSFRIQMPIASDYQSFYMYVPSIFDKTILTVDKLSFVYDQQVQVNLTGLTYKQVKEMSFLPQKNYLIGCKVNYATTIKFQNMTYYDSLDQINIYISNQNVLQLSTQCTSNLNKPYSCTKTSFGYQLVNLNQSNIIKSYEIARHEYYNEDPMYLVVGFGLQFVSSGVVDVEVVVKANGNLVQESWLNMTHNTSEVYGRGIRRIQGWEQEDFLKLTEEKYDPLMCLVPIIINAPSANNSTTTTNTETTNNTTIENTTSNNNTTQSNNTNTNSTSPTNTTPSTPSIPSNPTNDYTFDTTTGFEVNQLIFLLGLIVLIGLTLMCTQKIYLCMQLFYLVTIFVLAGSQIVFVVLSIDESWLKATSADLNDSLINSTTSNSAYSLQLFILKNTFLIQFLLNFFYFFNYFLLLVCSSEIKERIRKFYGTKYLSKPSNNSQSQQNTKINKCNFSSIIFTFVTFVMFLLSFKIYGALLFKLQLNLDVQDSDFRKYRFRNPVLYKMHAGHLAIDLLLEFNVLVWTFMLIKSCYNQTFVIFLYVFLVVYLVHVFLLTKVLKVFYLMARKSDHFIEKEKEKLKNTESFVEENQQNCEASPEEEKCDENRQNLNENQQILANEQQQAQEKPQNEPQELITFHMMGSKKKNTNSMRSSKFKK